MGSDETLLIEVEAQPTKTNNQTLNMELYLFNQIALEKILSSDRQTQLNDRHSY
jgi:hypothetical protein